MSNESINCYILPSSPLPMLLPVDCVAEIVEKPNVQLLEKPEAKWMKGYVTWQNQRLPVMSYRALVSSDLEELSETKPHLIVLNAVPDAARKAYSALLCYGEIEQVTIDDAVDFSDLPDGVDKRYVDAVVSFDGKTFVVPKLASLAVAFTYI